MNNNKKTITYNLQSWHFIIFVAIANIICMGILVTLPETPEGEEQGLHPILIIQVIATGTLIGLQIMYGRASFKKCGNCGHGKHQHNKESLVKKGYETLCEVICDNFIKANSDVNPIENYERKYSNGHK